MEDYQNLLLKSLHNAGVSFPSNVSSVGDLNPETLVSICAQSLNLLDPTVSFTSSLPDSLVDKFKICTDIALAIKRIGYIGDLTYYQLLYPSEEDLYKLVRFLVERLSKLPNGIQIPDLKDVSSIRKLKEDGRTENLKDKMKGADNNHPLEKFNGPSVHVVDEEFSDFEVKNASFSGSSKDNLTGVATRNTLVAEGEAERDEIESEESMDKKDEEPVQNVTSSCNKLSKTRHETKILQNQERVLMKDVITRTSELQKLEEELELLEAATEMTFDEQHPTEFYLKQLNEQIDVSKHNILELNSQWEAFRQPLEERKRSLEESLYANIPEGREKLQKLREVEVEKQSVLSEISRREVEYSNLLVDLENLPKLPSRTSYIEQIKEITKNSGKQDADIEGILKETRELQLESNSIQERLHRTYAVLDEVVFREAKKTPAGRQAYRRLTSIHECFEQITEKILMLDRVRREVVDHEKKLTGMASRSLSVDKLQADLDAILKENELLEQKRQE